MLNFVVNPKAGRGKGLANMKKIIKFLSDQGATFKVVYSERAKEIPLLVKKLCDDGADNVIAVGGDGTVNEALNGIVDFDKTTFGIIPSGNGNDFARFIGLSTNPLKALNTILVNNAAYTDFFEIGDESKKIRCMNIAGTGIDAEVLKHYNRSRMKGRMQYLWSLLVTIKRFQFFGFRAEINGQTSEHSGFIAAVCNGKQFGRGIPISPDSHVADGKLNLVIVNEIPRKKIMWALQKKLLKGKIHEVPEAEHHLVESVEIITERESFPLNVDGELFDDVKFICKIVQNKLKLYR